jgi:hypothetical protein
MAVPLRFLAIFTLLSSPSYSQFLHGKVIDQDTREPVPYANIFVQRKNAGCISDVNGEFTLNLRPTVQSDTIKITCVGYKTFRVPLSSLDVSKAKTFPLEEEVKVLKPVIISTAEKTAILGSSTKGKRKTGWGDFQSYRGRTKGLLIQDVVCKSRIKSFNFRIQDNEWDSVAFRLNIQQFRQGKPGETILPENILIITAAKKKWVTVDLRTYNIYICGSIIVSLEWVDSWGTTSPASSKLLTLSLSKESGYVFDREVFQESGTLTFAENTPAMYLVVYSE